MPREVVKIIYACADFHKSSFGQVFLDSRVEGFILFEGFSKLQDFVSDNLKKEIKWSTAIGIIEAVDHIYNEAISNGNIK